MKNETGDIRTLDGYFSFHANEEIFLKSSVKIYQK